MQVTADELDTTLDRMANENPGGIDFAEVVREHGQRIFNAVYCVVGNKADAEDVTQEVFLKAYQALGKFKGESKLSTWLYRIAMNAACDHFRRSGNTAPLKETFGAATQEEDIYSNRTCPGPESQYLKKETSETLRVAMMKLPLKYRTVLVLKEIEDRQYKEIAMILGISIGTVESRLFRAREILRKVMIKTAGQPGVIDETM